MVKKVFSRTNRRIAFMLLLIISMTFFTSLHADLLNASAANLGAVPAGGENEENEAAVIEQYFQYRFDQMKDKSGKIPDGVLIKALNERKAMAAKQENRSPFAAPVAGIDNTSWIEAGPQNVGGRIRAILPLSPSTVLIGGVSGGLWKTTNCCSTNTTWTPIDDWMANLGVSSLIMDPTNANVMYAGTGETSGTSFRGAGVFKSTDGGNTWIQLASTNNNQWYFVNRLAISPNGANLMAATGTGLYRSTDGGATWSQRVSSNWRDVKFDPTNSNNAVAGGSGFSWYTTNGGLNWTTATFNPAITGRVELAYSPSNPSIVYASINQNSGDVYKSIDGGHTYTRVNTGQQLLSSQGDYDNTIWVKPDDPNFVVVAGVDMYKSIDGGTTFTKIAYWGYSWHYRNPPSPHADHHALVSIPGSNLAMLNGNDGGIYYTADVTTAGTNADYNLGWVYMNNNLGITQFYGIAGNNNGVIIGGAQDNGATLYSPANGTNGWTYFSGGDGGKAAADPTNPNYIYNEYIYGKIYRSSDGGATVDKIDGTYWNGSAWVCRAAPYRIDDACNGVGSFIAPILLDPNNPNRLFVGDLSLWVSNDVRTPYDPYSPTGGPQWTALKPSIGSGINAIAVAPSDSNVIWVGYNNSRIDMTTDGGATWTRVDTNFGANYPGTRAGSIAIDKNDSNTVYVGFWGYGSNRIWRTQDGGATWTSIINNLPQTPVYAVAINPLNSAWLYVGTEIGIFASVDGGATWNVPAGTGKNGDGPANVATFDLQWMGGGNSWGSPILIAGTHGRGAWTADLTPPTVTSTYADDDSLCDGNIPCYATIAEAMNNVATGGTVTVYAGSYAENVTINRSVTLNVVGDMTTNDVSLYSGSTWNANSWTMTAGNVNVYGGTWNANNSTLTINDFNLASGTWNAGSSTITVNGNWAPSGTFNVGTGTVVFAKNGLVTVNNPAVTEGTISFCNLTISANTTVDVTDDFISAATSGGCTQYIQNGKLRREAPIQYIINYNLWTFKDARNRDAVLLTKTTGTSLHNTNVTITSNLQPPTTCGSNPLPAQPVLRQYNIVGTDMGGTYTTRLYFTTSNPDESNGNTASNLAIYHCNSSTSQWEKFTGTSGNDANGAYIQANVNSFVGSTFVIGSNNPINQAPVAVNDSYNTNENTALTIAAPGVLNNDTDANNNTLTAVKVTDPAHGTLTLNTSGSFTYSPAANYSGADSFTYKANDGSIDSNTATVNITVVPNEYTLTVNSAYGTVTKSPDKLTYHYGEVVTLSATADAGWTFTGWTPALTDNKVAISGNTTVTANFTQNEYTLTVNSAHGTVTRDNNGPYHLNDVVTLTAVADAGWTFTGWTPTLTDNKVTIAGNTTVTANFVQNEYTLTVNSAHGTVTRDNNGPYHLNDVVTLSVTVDAGWTFTGWTPSLTNNKVTITGDTTVTANYSQNEYTLTVISDHGTVTRDNNGPYHLNDVVTLTAVADAGWTFTGWTPALTDNKVTIADNTTVTANFVQNEYTLTVNSAHGTVTKTPDKLTYHYGDEVVLGVTADAGWTFTNWTPALTGNKVTITSNMTVAANFTQDEYTLTVNSAHGTVTKTPDKLTYHYGEEVTLSVIADAGWTFAGWAPPLTDNKVTITGNTTVTADFTQNEYTLTVLKVGNGTVTRDNNGPYHLNDVVTLTAVADEGWTFTGWTPALTDNKVTITGDTTVTANFTQNEYTLTVLKVGNGTVTRDNNGPYHLNDVVTLTAVADAGWTFTSWTPVLTENKVTITGDTTVTATFTQNEYTLTVLKVGNGTVTRDNNGPYHLNDVVTLTAVGDTGWTFTGWTPSLTNNKVTITGDTTVTATFTQNEYNLTIVSLHGTVTKSPDKPTYRYGDEVTLSVTSDNGWTFTGWTPALTANKFIITGDTTVTANFTQNEYILTVNSAHGAVTKTPDKLTYHYGEEVTLSVVADAGWMFTGWAPTLTANKVTITGDTTVTANFTQNEYTLTVNSAHGTVTKTPDKLTYHYGEEVALGVTADAGWTFTGWTPALTDSKVIITGDTTVTANFTQNEYTLTVNSAYGTVTRDNNGPYHLNDVVTLTVASDAGWTFTGWTPSLSANKVTITGDTTVTANFTQNEYTLTVNSAHGTVTKTPDQLTYHYGEEVTLSVTADLGWTFTGWTPSLTANKVTITGDTTVTANFTQNEYTLTVNSAHGTVTKSPDKLSYNYGEQVTLSMTADAGWTFTGWTPILTDNKVTITGDTTIAANFMQNEYDLTVVSAHGTVTRDNNGPYHLNDVVTLTVVADAGWTFTDWTPALTNNTVTITGDTTVTANYSQNAYTLSIVSAHGTVAKSPDKAAYAYGEVVQLTVIPDAGWSFANWTGDATGSANPVSVTMDGNKSVTANYSQNGYTLTVVSAHGMVTKSPDQATYHFGEEVTLSVTADTGWTFTGWTPALTNNKVTITDDTTVTANFTQDEYTLSIVSAHGTVTKSPDKATYHYGEEVTLSVTADAGWTFTGWTPALTDNKVTITGDTTVTASYSQDEYTLTVISTHGTVTRDNNGPYHLNDVVTLSVTADAGWTFTGWTPALTDNKITITGDTTITANFTQNEYTLTVISAHGTITRDNNGPYHQNDVVTLSVVADAGWTFTGWTPALTDNKVTITGNTTVTANFVVANTASVATNDSYTTDEDTALTVAAPGVLGNDTDADGNALTAILVNGPLHGTLTLDANGSFAYTPAAGYHGADSFTYKANDGQTDSNTATVSITVNHVNHAPVAVDDTASTTEATVVTVNALSNDSDPDGDTLSVTSVGAAAHGSVVIEPDFTLTYTPAALFNGTDEFTYTISDGNGDTATAKVTVTVGAVNDTPIAGNDLYATDEDTPLTIPAPGVLANDNDPDGDALTAVLVDNAAHGTLALHSDGSLTYTPAANFNGSDSFTYKANDGTVDSNTATVNITVNAVNDAPVTIPQSISVDEDGSVSIILTGSDVDGDALTFSVTADPVHGTLSGIAPDLTYTPNADYNGADNFTFKVSDGFLEAQAQITITVNPINDAPVAVLDAYETDENAPLDVPAPGVLANDTDVDGDALTAVLVGSVSHGTLVFNADGSFLYTPEANFNGEDSFTYKANDGVADSNGVTGTIKIHVVNYPPSASNDTYNTDEDTTLTIAAPGLLGNDSDADGDMLSAVKATDPSHGTLTLNADGSFTYTPAANWHGIDTFTYKATDGIQESNSAEVTIVVESLNDAPIAVTQSVQLDEDAQKAITLIGSDVDGDTLTYTILAMPANGVLSDTAPNVSYTPNANFFGDDFFTFTVNDGNLTSVPATVNIHVNSVNDVPVCLSLSLTTDEDIASTRSPSCTDVDNTTLSYQIVAPAGHGTASISGGLLAYGPDTNYNGADAFTYKANDGVSDSNTANVAVTVNPINDAPMANNQSVTTDQNTPKAITLTGSDVEGSPLIFAIVTGPTHGSLSGTSPSVTYTPAAGYSGSDSFTFKVDDGALDSNIATVSITVVAVNHAPVAMNDAYSTNANTTLTVAIPGVLSNDTDPDGNALSAVNVTNPAHGTLTLNTNGSFTYTPATGYVGSDSFTYKASDSALNSNAATVTITVDAVQHPALTLTKSASPTIYSYPNQTITYTYVVKNTGDVVLTGPFLISDDKLGSFKCGIVTSLAVNASVTCSKNYTIVASDLNLTNNATITNHATVSGKFGTTVVTSNQVQVTIRQAASTAKITSSNATCSQFKAGASVDLLEEFYTVKLGKVNSISPGVFQYYTAVTAPASTFQVTVQQTDPTNWPAIGVQNLNVYVYNANCSGVSFSAVIYSNKVTFTIRNAKAGATYYLAVKYQPNSLVGQKVNTPYPTVPYLFTTSVNNNEVITSWDSLNIKPR